MNIKNQLEQRLKPKKKMIQEIQTKKINHNHRV